MKLDPKIRDRMARLKAMAEDCANENEAMIAARRLHALEAKHGVSMDDIAYSDLEIGEHGVDISRSVGGGVWVHWIASAVSELYFCSCYIDSGRAKSKGAALSVILVGADHHRDIASAMVNSVISAVARQAKAESKANRPKGEDPWAFITSFRKAAAERISVRCNLMVAEARRGELADEEGGYLPVMADKYDRMALEVQGWMDRNLNLRREKRKHRDSSQAGRAAGDQYGSRVALAGQLGAVGTKAIK